MTRMSVSPGIVAGDVRAPPSKSYTHRALIAGHLTGRRYRVLHPLLADDTRATRRGLTALGSKITDGAGGWSIRPRSISSRPSAPARIDCGESGTTFRFLVALAASRSRPTRFEGPPQLGRRPIEGLLRPLQKAGAHVELPAQGGLPLRIEGPIRPGPFVVDGSVSSQYVSGLLFVLPTLPGTSTLRVTGAAVSAPYIAATEEVLRAHGIRFDRRGRRWSIEGRQRYRGSRFDVPGDASSAAYLWVAAALTGGSVRVSGIPAQWPQADRRILEILRLAGATVRESGASVRVEGPVTDGFDVDLTESPDLYPLVGVLAAGIRSTSQLRGAPHLVFKESDRRAATLRLVRGMGAIVRSSPDGLRIEGSRNVRRLDLHGLDDHRVVMSAAVGALVGSRPSVLGDAESVAKSFPSFWQVLRQLGAEVRTHR